MYHRKTMGNKKLLTEALQQIKIDHKASEHDEVITDQIYQYRHKWLKIINQGRNWKNAIRVARKINSTNLSKWRHHELLKLYRDYLR